MTLFKIEEMLSEHRPGMSLAEIRSMPFYELALKMKIMEERAKEQEQKQKKEQGAYSIDKYKDMYKSSGKFPSMPSGMPKMPSGF